MTALLSAPSERRLTLRDRIAPAAAYLNSCRFPGVWFEVSESEGGHALIRGRWEDGSFADFYVASAGGRCYLEATFVSMPRGVVSPLECARCEFRVDEGPPVYYPAGVFAAVVLALRTCEATAGRI
ncbi:MAG TPA: hypothetical protein VNU68_22515 [Verrucomicrobiae bacterium]|nr:hypothetical protein [Verrucomicrobiae bacterium]